jgi:glycolate oxidase
MAATPPSRRGVGYEYRAGLTWDTLDAIKETAGLPFILKGVATAEDAQLAVDHGVDAIYVSNHGRRQLDHNRATIEMLPEIVDAVRHKPKSFSTVASLAAATCSKPSPSARAP